MFTAIVATVGAIFGYMSGATQANAGLYKNNAAIKKTEASNQWNYYQAKSSKQNLAELALELSPAKREFYETEIKRYKAEKAEIRLAAEMLGVRARALPAHRPGGDHADRASRRPLVPAGPRRALPEQDVLDAGGLHRAGRGRGGRRAAAPTPDAQLEPGATQRTRSAACGRC